MEKVLLEGKREVESGWKVFRGEYYRTSSKLESSQVVFRIGVHGLG